MARNTLAKLVALQQHRIDEIKGIGDRLKERAPDTLNKIILDLRIKTVSDRWADVRSTHDELVTRADAQTHEYITGNRYNEMQDTYEETIDWLLTRAMELSEVEQPRGRVRDRERDNDDDEDDRPAKLPRLDLPTFSGKYEDWDSFADLFTTLVHDVPRISNTRKLQYLKSCLAGPAAELVKGVQILGVNYESTWKALRDRFYNPRLTVNKLLDALNKLPYLKKESANDLRAFVDDTQQIVRALTNLSVPVAHWDLWLVHTVEVRLDEESRKTWEAELIMQDRQVALLMPDNENNRASRFPKFVDLIAFLERRAQSLSIIHADKEDKKGTQPTSSNSSSRRVHHSRASGDITCAYCKGDHFIWSCQSYIDLPTVKERKAIARKLRLCFNCLGMHRREFCKSKYTCKECQSQDHHSLLHTDNNEDRAPASAPNKRPKFVCKPKGKARATQKPGKSTVSVNACKTTATSECSVLLATAQVTAFGPHGKQTRVRALLDQGSEATFVSESVVQLLGLYTDRVQTELTGVGGCKAGVVKQATTFTIQSRVDPKFKLEVNAFVLPQLTSQLPSRDLIELDLGAFEYLSLADPEFHLSDRVDLMIGADLYGQLLRSGIMTFPSTPLVAQNTALGWVVSGPTKGRVPRRAAPRKPTSVKALRCVVNDDLTELIQRFWTVEEVPTASKTLNPQDEACERLFAETHTRDSEGRFTVRLPLISDLPEVGFETRRIALGSLKHQHQRFARDPKLASAYIDFMETYEKLGHMVPVPLFEINNPRAWYMPHHAVVSGDPANPKTRVVFNASMPTPAPRKPVKAKVPKVLVPDEKYRLNQFVMAGPALQNDLSLILLNWCQYRYVFTADIVKMFRQIRVAKEDQDLQRIVWSPSPLTPPTHYRLTTVTYGTACAPYLAIRTLLQLASDERARFPLGAACLESDTYVDDTFSGADELATAVRKRDELVGILKSAGIELDKWAANHSRLLPSSAQSNNQRAIKEIDHDTSIKALGVHYNPSSDKFNFSSSTPNKREDKLTKRSVYSEIARLFDPLGWLAPVTVVAKILMQDLWIEKWDWDAKLSNDICDRWYNYCQSLSALPKLSIDRWLGVSHGQSFEIHGFSDASSRAYAASVYLRVNDGYGNYRVSLLSAKTKPSPVKTISIPNLELCGATLLVKLVCHLQKLEFLKGARVHLWSDSQIVLTWLKKHPCHWKTFVANRVSLIQTELPAATWAHVPTKQNPADLATRGATPEELRTCKLWWRGPAWLAAHSNTWPQPPRSPQALHVRPGTDEPVLLTRYSSLIELTRVAAWCLRPLLQVRRRRAGQGSFPSYLTAVDLDNARNGVVMLAQSHTFSSEIDLLKNGKELPKRSPIRNLRPFLDTDGILRVRGRLSNANIPHSVMHPPILPRNSALSRLFALHAHHKALHGGPTLTLSVLLRSAWIVGMRPLVKTLIRKCILCQRHKPRLARQLMGDLPEQRVNPSPAFTTTGLDYAGPFHVRTSKGRGVASYKGYIALFVCFATKAVHLEVVSDLTSATFIAAFRRFVSRRGRPKELYSDNATTFRGADAELRAMFKNGSEFYKETASVLEGEKTSWTFIPPTTPHYGGLWEAGVKSTKNLLKKTIGDNKLTFEELSTVLAEIEACLNSRPLCPLTSSLDDLQALTPSQLLIGMDTGVIPDAETPAVPENRLDRFQRLQRIRDHFWRRWSNEYVLRLQERAKWQNPTPNFTVGQLVVLKDDRYPISKWPLGRVLELHPGADGLVRVVTVKTATNTLRRHIACLAPLTLDQPEDQEELTHRAHLVRLHNSRA